MSYTLNGFGDIDGLIKHFRRDGESLKVDIGCGFHKPAGFIGVDNLVGADSQVETAANMPDILMDLNSERVPLPDDSCCEVRASHFLEHSNLPHILDEVHRLLQSNGLFLFAVPYANSAEGMDPGHHIFLTEKWFYENLQFQRLFSIEREEYKKSDIYTGLPLYIRAIPFSVARQIFFNVCKEMTIWARPKAP